MVDRTCKVEGCGRPVGSRGWCGTHYQRWRKFGSPGDVAVGYSGQGIPVVERFLAKVSALPNGCWPWLGAKGHLGYGSFGPHRKTVAAHRWSYEFFVAPIPAGLHIDHLCRYPPCVNPDHLEPVTQRENTLRGVSLPAQRAARTHCVHGHLFDEANTRITSRGQRVCRACHVRRVVAAKKRKRNESKELG